MIYLRMHDFRCAKGTNPQHIALSLLLGIPNGKIEFLGNLGSRFWVVEIRFMISEAAICLDWNFDGTKLHILMMNRE